MEKGKSILGDAQDIKIFNIAKIIITTTTITTTIAISIIKLLWEQSFVLKNQSMFKVNITVLAELLYLAGQPRPYLCKSRTCPDTALAYLPVLMLQEKMPPELNLSGPDSSFKVEIWRRKSIFQICPAFFAHRHRHHPTLSVQSCKKGEM